MFSGNFIKWIRKKNSYKNDYHITDKTQIYSNLALILQADKFSMVFLKKHSLLMQILNVEIMVWGNFMQDVPHKKDMFEQINFKYRTKHTLF